MATSKWSRLTISAPRIASSSSSTATKGSSPRCSGSAKRACRCRTARGRKCSGAPTRGAPYSAWVACRRRSRSSASRTCSGTRLRCTCCWCSSEECGEDEACGYVQDLLGHSNREMTKDIYLAVVKNIAAKAILNRNEGDPEAARSSAAAYRHMSKTTSLIQEAAAWSPRQDG